jgi:hypothetical protein
MFGVTLREVSPSVEERDASGVIDSVDSRFRSGVLRSIWATRGPWIGRSLLMSTSEEVEKRSGTGDGLLKEGWRKRPPGPETMAGEEEFSGWRMRATRDSERFEFERARGCEW